MSSTQQFVTTGQAAKLLSVSLSTVARWIREGRIPARRLGSRHQVPVAAVEAMIATSAVVPASESEAK